MSVHCAILIMLIKFRGLPSSTKYAEYRIDVLDMIIAPANHLANSLKLVLLNFQNVGKNS
jgi:hypothetical protein